MIPILHEPTDYNFDTFGIGLLKDTISCEVTEERNGIFELTLKYPVKGNLYGYLKKECLIVVKPNDISIFETPLDSKALLIASNKG